MIGSFSIWHYLILALVVILVFGTGKLKNAGKDLGIAIRDFKKGLHEEENKEEEAKKKEQ